MSKVEDLKNEYLIVDPDEYQEIYLNLLESAESEIILETYIFEDDHVGRPVLQLLEKKAKEGISVRLLVDGAGSRTFANTLKSRPKISNMEIRVFHPLPFFRATENFFTEVLDLQRLTKSFGRINRRNHKKVLVVDRQRAMLGSRNVFKEALNWRETSVFVKDERVPLLVASFEVDWQKSVRIFKRILSRIKAPLIPQLRRPRSDLFLSQSRAQKRFKHRYISNKFSEAKHRILITTPYFNPPYAILKSLYGASKRGVKIQVLLPARSDVKTSKLIARSFYNSLLIHQIEIFEYLPAMLHAKTMVVDDWSLVGSSNFNQRSYRRDYEVDLPLTSLDTVEVLTAQFSIDLQKSHRIDDASGWASPFIWLGAKFLSLFTSSF